MQKRERSFSVKKILLAIGALSLIVGATVAFVVYQRFLAPNVTANQPYLYIPTDSGFEDLMKNLGDNEIVEDTATFRWVAIKQDYPLRVKAGKYKLTEGMNNRTLINELGAG